MSAPTKLFDAFRLGPFALSNRVVMAPLTRNRAQPPGMVPGLLAAEYYRQRALNEWDTATFYGGGAKGYTDYLTLASPRGTRYQTRDGATLRPRAALIRREEMFSFRGPITSPFPK